MLQNIIEGIVAMLKAESEIPVYTKPAEETTVAPYFYVSCESGTAGRVVGRRDMRSYHICIEYHPSTEESILECAQKMEQLFGILGMIDADGTPLRGTDINGKIEDSILQVKVTYAFYLLENVSETAMEAVAITTSGER